MARSLQFAFKRLFQRSTRRLTLTQEGECFWQAVAGGVETIQSAIAAVRTASVAPAGTLKLSMAPGFAQEFALAMLPGLVQRYPEIRHDWHFDNRKVDLIGEGFDAAIAGGLELAPGVVARELARIHLVAVAAPAYLQQRKTPRKPEDLHDWDWMALRSVQHGRLRPRQLRHRQGRVVEIETAPRYVFDDPQALVRAVQLGLGVALVPMPHALPLLEQGQLQRVLSLWYWDAGPLQLYYPGKKLLPAKTRVFIDYLVEQFRDQGLAQRLRAD